jgi:hypothetical protein
VKLVLELFLLKIDGDDVLFERHEAPLAESRQDPNDVAEELLRACARGDMEGAFVHSSSWRYAAEPGCVLLTFFSYSDRFVLDEDSRRLPLREVDTQRGNSNCESEEYDVAAHAVRHLAFLLEAGEADESNGAFQEESLRALRGVRSELAGVIFKGRG